MDGVGRKIVVFTGMLKQVADEDQLAGILAHGKIYSIEYRSRYSCSCRGSSSTYVSTF